MTGPTRCLRTAWAAVRRVAVSALLTTPAWWVAPTFSTLAFNAKRVENVAEPAVLPPAQWSQRERHAMMSRSEDRLRTIEAKGPGLAAITAVIAATVLLAIDSGWTDSCWVAQILLGLAAFYAAFSLALPLYLVGPQSRQTIHERELRAAGASDDPEEALAREAARAALSNDRRNLLLSNAQVAARRETIYALVLLLIWVFAVPVTGILAT